MNPSAGSGQAQETRYTLDLNPSTSLRAGAGLTQVLADSANAYLYGCGRISQTEHATSSTSYFLTDLTNSVTLPKSYQPRSLP